MIILFLWVEVSVSSCMTASREEKYYERQETKKVAEDQKKYEKSVKGHKKNQSKEAQKMIKKTERESRKLNRSHKVKSKKC